MYIYSTCLQPDADGLAVILSLGGDWHLPSLLTACPLGKEPCNRVKVSFERQKCSSKHALTPSAYKQLAGLWARYQGIHTASGGGDCILCETLRRPTLSISIARLYFSILLHCIDQWVLQVVSVSVQLYCMLVSTVFHCMFRPTHTHTHTPEDGYVKLLHAMICTDGVVLALQRCSAQRFSQMAFSLRCKDALRKDFHRWCFPCVAKMLCAKIFTDGVFLALQRCSAQRFSQMVFSLRCKDALRKDFHRCIPCIAKMLWAKIFTDVAFLALQRCSQQRFSLM
jgi:hypothetical protein